MNANQRLLSIKKQKGYLLVLALGFIVMFSMIFFMLTQQLSASSRVQLLSTLSNQAENAALSGAEEGVYRLKQYDQCLISNRVYDTIGLKGCQVNISCNKSFIEMESEKKQLHWIVSEASCGTDALYSSRMVKLSFLSDINQKYRMLYRVVE